MLTIAGILIMLLGGLIAAIPDLLPVCVRQQPEGALSRKAHRTICCALVAAGCFLRLWRIGSLPSGISAEEALVGVQAKSLWQTGGFLFSGRLTTQFAQWTGESGGPLLATLTAPFVGLFGMTPLATRLPLALLSCAAMPAAYALGKELSGRRAALCCLAAYALCPYFALTGRLTYGLNVAVCLMPVAVWLLVSGVKRGAMLYAGALLTALLAYAQDMFFFLSPAFIVIACLTAAAYGTPKRHALGAALLGLAVCVPALLTLWVNMGGREGFTLLGVVDIPRLEEFDKAGWVFEDVAQNAAVFAVLLNKAWSVVIGGVFQAVRHENISSALFMPDGMLALYAFSVPLILLGAASLFARRAHAEKVEAGYAAGRTMIVWMALATLALLTLFGTKGTLIINGTTSAPDISSFFLFDVLLLSAGFGRVARKNRVCARALTALFVIHAVVLTGYVAGGGYEAGANVYFNGFGELAVREAELQRETGAKANITSSVYPHREPDAAAAIMYLYATDADMREAAKGYGTVYEVNYISPDSELDTAQLYLLGPQDAAFWDGECFDYEQAYGFVLLMPAENQRAGLHERP